MNQYFELVEIRSEDDLPKDLDTYFCISKDGEKTVRVWDGFPYSKKAWLAYIKFYFRPIQVSKEVVYGETEKEGDDHSWLRSTESIIVKQ